MRVSSAIDLFRENAKSLHMRRASSFQRMRQRSDRPQDTGKAAAAVNDRNLSHNSSARGVSESLQTQKSIIPTSFQPRPAIMGW